MIFGIADVYMIQLNNRKIFKMRAEQWFGKCSSDEIDGRLLISEEEVPLNLSTKPSDVSSSIGRKSEIWSPGSVCEREARETRAPSSRSPSSTPIITRQIHHSPLTPPSSTERTFQVSVSVCSCIIPPYSHSRTLSFFRWSCLLRKRVTRYFGEIILLNNIQNSLIVIFNNNL